MTPDAIRHALERGLPIADASFDAIYPHELRGHSELHWTPIAIARRAAALFELGPGHRVLDVGCSVGKACLVGALASGATWWGVDRDPALIEVATETARTLGVYATRFLCGDANTLDWSQFDGLYFYNPFPPRPESHPNAFVRYSQFVQGVEGAELQLPTLRPGARVVTYHGFGGDMPAGFELCAREPAGNDELQLWVRT
ncbi:MAG TPA: class I SAM-dependent methyltransferase [Kofleriaceae bacterium]|nr:class I SAM-dependent methyltransferase [Kofleriaceae bacterium]